MPKVLLIQPTQYGTHTGKLCKQRKIFLPGLALPLLASYTPVHWDVKILIEVVDEIDFDEDCDLVGIGAMGHAVFRAIDIAFEFKKRGKLVFMGGYMVSILPNLVKEHCDSVVIGDGEISYPQLLHDFETTGKIKPIYSNPIANLAGIKIPRYDLLLKKRIGYMLPVQAGRGCPHTCSFCSIACIYKGQYSTRPVDEVIRDILHIKNLGFKRFFLIDDNIASNQDFLFDLALKIKPLKMKWASQCSILIAKNEKLLKVLVDSGCIILSLGIESTSQEGLNKLNKKWVKVNETAFLLKKIQKAGLLPATEMIIGTDGDTLQSIKETANFIVNNHIPLPKFYVLTPLPGTEFYNQMKYDQRLIHEDFTKYNATQCVFAPSNLSPDELERAYWKLYVTTYSFNNILKRTLFNPNFFKSPLVYLFAFFTNIIYKRSINQGDAPNIL